MPKDELGIEYDTDVEAVIKDPKSTVLQKTLKYFNERAQKEAELEAAKKKPADEKKWYEF